MEQSGRNRWQPVANGTAAKAAQIVMGTGFLALAWQSMRSAAGKATWSRFTGLVGFVLLATAAAYAARAFDLVDLLLVVGGVLLLPAWLVWTGRLLRERPVAQARGVEKPDQ